MIAFGFFLLCWLLQPQKCACKSENGGELIVNCSDSGAALTGGTANVFEGSFEY